MAPFFTFFVPKKDPSKVAPYIKLLDNYYPSFVDGKYIEPAEMKRRYSGANAKFFAFDFGDLVMFDLETVDLIEPMLALTMDISTKMRRADWLIIFKFLKSVFIEEYPDMTQMETLVPKPVAVKEKVQLMKSKEIPKPLNEDYGFTYELSNDICICQVDKPFTDLPYTCVIRDFSKVGFDPLFTAFYVCQSWGVSNHDHVFLLKLWAHLGMQGSLNIEQKLIDEIEKCKNGKPEPEVYRLDISAVKGLLSKKQKRQEELMDPNKFVRL